jgi:serine/threonine protein phosphatase PrpC
METANSQVCELGTGAATTMAVLEIGGDLIRPYHVGDSAILVVGNRGRVKMHTMAHSPVGYAVQAGVLDEQEAIFHEDRHLVSNFIGDREAHIEVGSPRKLNQRDTVVMGSDGLFDNLQVSEIAEIVRKGPILDAATRLAETATRRMANLEPDLPSKPDDLTFVLFRMR